MAGRRGGSFVTGLLTGGLLGLLCGLMAVYLAFALDVVSVSLVQPLPLQALTEWVRRNLGLSVIPFGLTLGFYLHSLQGLAQRLDRDRPQDEVAQFEHLTEVWTSLFFGVGVIWTAIGMRAALLHALGDPGVAVEAGAFAVLQRLVDGGVLTALTTTIVGGIGGYLMRVSKSFFLGARLSCYYEQQDRHHAQRIEGILREIHASIGELALCPSPGEGGRAK
jgi:hypothetical protein